MKTTLRTDLTIGEIIEGFEYSEAEEKGLYGWNGKLTIQPEYQRNYIYGDGKKDVFHATYINTPHRTQNGSGIIDIIADTEYNNFSLNG